MSKSKYHINKAAIEYLTVSLLITTVLLCGYPYVFYRFIPLPHILFIAMFILVLLAILLFFKRDISLLPKSLSYVVVVQILVWAIYVIIHGIDTMYYAMIIYIILSYISLICLNNCDKGIDRFLHAYNNWVVIMAVCGAICFFLILIFGMPPLFEFENQDGRQAYCFGLTCTNSYWGDIIRFAGFFDEPGAMANWGVFALLMNKIAWNNSKCEKALMFSLVFTFSLAYYIQLFFYICCYKLKNIKTIITAIVVVAVVAIGIYSTKGTEYDIYNLTFARLEINTSTGLMAGDNRSELSELAKEQFYKAPIFGIGETKMAENEYMADNPYEVLARSGLVGTIVTYLPLILMFAVGVSRKDKDIICASCIIAVGYLQRPFHLNFMHPFILYSIVLLSLYKPIKGRMLLVKK